MRVGASYDDLTRGHYAHTLHGLMCCTEVRMIGPIDLLVVQAGATWFLTGLIWLVQVVHYPLFAGVGRAGYADYQAKHVKRITWVVAPVMLVEAATAVAMVWRSPAEVPVWSVWTGLVMLAGVWASTAALQVPAHGKLETGFDARVHQRLVRSNWLRTVLWTGRGVLVGWMVRQVMGG